MLTEPTNGVSATADAGASTAADHTPIGLMDLEIHLRSRAGVSHRVSLPEVLEQHEMGHLPSTFHVDQPNDRTGVDFGVAVIIPVRVPEGA